MRGAGCIGGLGVLAVLMLGSAAGAQEGQEPIRVEYQGAPGCPDEPTFFSQVLARTPRARRAADPAPARTFVVSLTRGAEASFGRLFIRGTDGSESERDVAGDTCEEVVSALSLITALAVDPRASLQPLAPAVAPTPAVDPTPAAAPAPVPAPLPPPASGPAPDPAPAHPWHFALAFEASVAAGVTPRVLFATPLSVQAMGPEGRTPSPTFRVGFERASSGSVDVGGPTATFTWTLGIAEACPHRWRFGKVAVEPCARVEAGVLEGIGANIAPARDSTRTWFALGATGRAEWAFLPPMFLDLEAGLSFPLVRTTYFFEPNTTVYQSPTVGGIVSAGLGVRFL
jgi:hypothetical protein